MAMPSNDIDEIIAEVQAGFPQVRVIQTHKTWPDYDVNVWRFIVDRTAKESQLHSRSCSLPFLVKHDGAADSDVFTVHTVAEAGAAVLNYLRSISARTKPCEECGSWYFADTSEMGSMCPECSSIIFGYDPCVHVFVNRRCSLCHWDGSASKYIKNRLKKMGIKWKRPC